MILDPYLRSIEALCRRYGVRRLELFGSGLRSDFNPDTSDYDFFVDFGSQPETGSFKRYMGLKFDLETLLNRSVDLVERDAVTNPYFLQATLERAEVYAA